MTLREALLSFERGLPRPIRFKSVYTTLSPAYRSLIEAYIAECYSSDTDDLEAFMVAVDFFQFFNITPGNNYMCILTEDNRSVVLLRQYAASCCGKKSTRFRSIDSEWDWV